MKTAYNKGCPIPLRCNQAKGEVFRQDFLALEWNRNKLRFLMASFGLLLRHKNLTLGGIPLGRPSTTPPFLLLG
jgi:hypothetical protein